MPTHSIKTSFTELFKIPYPIVGAPMFLVSTENLVTSVSDTGGLGTFPALNFRPIDKYREAVETLKKKTSGPFGINIIVQKSNKYQYEQLDIALENEVALIITSLGNPAEVIKKAHQTKTKVFCDVVGSEHGRKVHGLGADGLIAVGHGAGGHAGNISPFVLIPQLVSETGLPVLAAGNIVDGKGLAAALSLGASGVYIGTRFIASSEAEVDEKFKSDILEYSSEDIVNTDKVDGFPGNFIFNETLQKLGLEKGIFELILSKNKKLKKTISLSRAAKSLLGSKSSKYSFQNVFSAGQGIGLIDDIKPVAEIIKGIVFEYENIIKSMPEVLPDQGK